MSGIGAANPQIRYTPPKSEAPELGHAEGGGGLPTGCRQDNWHISGRGVSVHGENSGLVSGRPLDLLTYSLGSSNLNTSYMYPSKVPPSGQPEAVAQPHERRKP